MQEVFEKIIEEIKEKSYEIQLDGAIVAATKKVAEVPDIVNIVNTISEEYNNGWIPCSNRLPENNNVVLCWVVSKTIASGETFIIGSCDRGFWFLQTYEIGHHHFPVKDYEVVAWQPLPEPYQPKGE